MLNRLEIFNELCILGAAYHLLIFTNFDLADPRASLNVHFNT